MSSPYTMDRRGSWAVGGMTLVGVGVGFIFLRTSVFFFVASILVGIGLGLVIAAVISRAGADTRA